MFIYLFRHQGGMRNT